MSSLTRLSEWLLRQPVVWGGLAAMACYALVVQPAAPGSLVAAAFGGALWQLKALATLVCGTALAALAMRLLNLREIWLAVVPPLPMAADGEGAEDAAELLAELNDAPATLVDAAIGRRLQSALQLVQQRGSAAELEADLRMLAEQDRQAVATRS
ncbi:MAG TPA: hypothetical protein PKC18_20925, partial [Lacipirellulaceae bacterium]|nr:hypothetical protein [Lacipirellulaceae bacterium]